jgi:hypothetical protein
MNKRHHLSATQQSRMFSTKSFLLINLWLGLLLYAVAHSLIAN